MCSKIESWLHQQQDTHIFKQCWRWEIKKMKKNVSPAISCKFWAALVILYCLISYHNKCLAKMWAIFQSDYFDDQRFLYNNLIIFACPKMYVKPSWISILLWTNKWLLTNSLRLLSRKKIYRYKIYDNCVNMETIILGTPPCSVFEHGPAQAM